MVGTATSVMVGCQARGARLGRTLKVFCCVLALLILPGLLECRQAR